MVRNIIPSEQWVIVVPVVRPGPRGILLCGWSEAFNSVTTSCNRVTFAFKRLGPCLGSIADPLAVWARQGRRQGLCPNQTTTCPRRSLPIAPKGIRIAVSSKILRIPTEHIDSICSLDSELSFDSICSFGTLDIFEVTEKMSFSKSSTKLKSNNQINISS